MPKSDEVQAGTTTSPARDVMLLEFLRAYDADCPACGYNLRALTRPVCPECNQDLVLTVGAKRVRMAWLFAALAPGFFSGIAAVFLLIPIVGRLAFGDGLMSPALNAIDLFGWFSGVFAIILAMKHRRFLAQPLAKQRWVALLVWLIHIVALALAILIGPKYL